MRTLVTTRVCACGRPFEAQVVMKPEVAKDGVRVVQVVRIPAHRLHPNGPICPGGGEQP